MASRLSAWLIGLLPFANALYMYAVNPKYNGILWESLYGINMVDDALVMMLIGSFIALSK